MTMMNTVWIVARAPDGDTALPGVAAAAVTSVLVSALGVIVAGAVPPQATSASARHSQATRRNLCRKRSPVIRTLRTRLFQVAQ
ncbi:MAG: hypothetical protein ACTHMJ_06620 [Thermomicrobiales bacterium]